MPRPSVVVAIVEDDHHKMLIYRYLRNRGLGPRQITITRSPSAQGSAEQWVRSNFAKEVRAYRNRQAKAASALILMIDADTHTVHGRLTQLSEALEEGGIEPIHNEEQIARLIPKRNVETWIACLNEQKVDEETDYKPTANNWGKLVPLAAQALFEWTRPNAVLPRHCIDSLRVGVSEMNRVEF